MTCTIRKTGKALERKYNTSERKRKRENRETNKLPIQIQTRFLDYIRNPVDPGLGSCPVTRVDGVSNSREESLVVAGPGLRREEDVFELRAVGDLFLFLISKCIIKIIN
jgi:hypothetical protein